MTKMVNGNEKILTSPYYWECSCEIPEAIHLKSVTTCPTCKAHQDDCADARVYDLMEYDFDLYPTDDQIKLKVGHGLNILTDVMTRQNRHGVYITDKLIFKNQFIKWSERGTAEMVTDGIGVFISKVCRRLRQLAHVNMTALKVHKFANEAGNGNYIIVEVGISGIPILTDGMTDFSGSGGRAYKDMLAVLSLWGWLYGEHVVEYQHTNDEYKVLCSEIASMVVEDE